MTAITSAAMIARAKAYAGYDAGMASSSIPDATWLLWLNAQLSALYDLLVQARGEDWYAAFAATVIASGTATVALPAAQGSAVLLVQIYRAPQYYDVPKAEMHDVPRLCTVTMQGGGSDPSEIRYRLEPTLIRLLPTPRFGATITIHYVPAFTPLTLAAPGDTFDGVNGWEDWACLGAAACAMASKREDPGHVRAQQAQWGERIAKLAASRDAGRPYQIQDTRRGGAWHGLFRDWNG